MRQDVKEQIKRYYDQEAALRDGKSVRADWKAEFRQAFLDRALQEGKKTLLELGAGAGYDSRFFQDGGLRVTAVDLSTEMVRRCRAKGVEAYELELCRLSELERQFDSCIPSMFCSTSRGRICVKSWRRWTGSWPRRGWSASGSMAPARTGSSAGGSRRFPTRSGTSVFMRGSPFCRCWRSVLRCSPLILIWWGRKKTPSTLFCCESGGVRPPSTPGTGPVP